MSDSLQPQFAEVLTLIKTAQQKVIGFGYQVQKVGAKNAIASLWNVNDEGTQALMAVFYDELKKGDITSTEALHRAQVALVKSPKYNHPNYWSAFFAIGNGL